MKRMEVVKTLAKALDAKKYLEIGVEKGPLFKDVRVHERIAVDPKFLFSLKTKLIFKFQALAGHKDHYFEMTSDRFFEEHSDVIKDGFDLAFVDGKHTSAQALKDVDNCLRFLNPGGIILLHDCNPRTKAIGWPAESWEEVCEIEPEGWTIEWSGDVWKAAVELRCRDDLSFYTLDCDYGIGIIRKEPNPGKPDINPEKIADLTYEDLATNRESYLNLRKPEFLYEFAESL